MTKYLTRLDFFRDCMARVTQLMSTELADVGALLTSFQREAGFVAYAKVSEATDAMFALVNELDEVEYKTTEEEMSDQVVQAPNPVNPSLLVTGTAPCNAPAPPPARVPVKLKGGK